MREREIEREIEREKKREKGKYVSLTHTQIRTQKILQSLERLAFRNKNGVPGGLHE